MSVFATTPLRQGKSVIVRIVTPVNSKKVYKQEVVCAQVDADVKSQDGKVLIKTGTPVEMHIETHKAAGLGASGSVSAYCVSTTAVDGQRIFLKGGSIEAEGESRRGLAIGLGVGLGVTALPYVGFIFLVLKGENAQIDANTIMNYVVVAGNYDIE